MKTYILLSTLACSLSTTVTHAQQNNATVYRKQLPELIIAPDQTLHIISPEPISYVDISSNQIIGDLPLDNVLRLKLSPDSTQQPFESDINEHDLQRTPNLGTISIAGETFVTQYSLQRAHGQQTASLPTKVNIRPIDMAPLNISGIGLSTPQIKNKALQILTEPKSLEGPVQKNKEFGITLSVNGLYSAAEYIFIDLSIANDSKLQYDPDELRFFIEDKKITKATNVQSIEIIPVFALHPLSTFKRSFRNIYVIKKVTFPGSKVLKVSLSEQQLSGRTIELKIKYQDILEADSI